MSAGKLSPFGTSRLFDLSHSGALHNPPLLLDVFSVPPQMLSVDFYSLALTIPALVFLAHFVPWLVDPRGIGGYPGPFLAKFSDLWLGYVSKMGHRSEVVHKVHQKYGMPSG